MVVPVVPVPVVPHQGLKAATKSADPAEAAEAALMLAPAHIITTAVAAELTDREIPERVPTALTQPYLIRILRKPMRPREHTDSMELPAVDQKR